MGYREKIMSAYDEMTVVQDLDRALNGQIGKFEVTTTNGARFVLTVIPGWSLSDHPILSMLEPQPFRVRRLSNHLQAKQKKAHNAQAKHLRTTQSRRSAA
jgi:hypothetical protein